VTGGVVVWAEPSRDKVEAAYALLRRPEWHRRAACRSVGVEVMFPNSRGNNGAWDVAEAVCRRCPVIVECSEAGRDESYGVWGGRRRVGARLSPGALYEVIAGGGTWSVDELVAVTGMREQRVRAQLHAMSKKGWVELWKDPEDKRRYLCRIATIEERRAS
jgi:hypothetical protein